MPHYGVAFLSFFELLSNGERELDLNLSVTAERMPGGHDEQTNVQNQRVSAGGDAAENLSKRFLQQN